MNIVCNELFGFDGVLLSHIFNIFVIIVIFIFKIKNTKFNNWLNKPLNKGK